MNRRLAERPLTQASPPVGERVVPPGLDRARGSGHHARICSGESLPARIPPGGERVVPLNRDRVRGNDCPWHRKTVSVTAHPAGAGPRWSGCREY